MRTNAIHDISSFLYWVTYGVFSGYFQANGERFEAMSRAPSLYTVANWLLSGTPDLLADTFNPDEPLSFEH